MTTVMERMREELVRRNYAANTVYTYTKIVVEFQGYIGKPLEEADADDLRRYHSHLLDEWKLDVRTVVQRVAAIRVLYCKALKRRDMKGDLPYPRKYRRRLPVILSIEEVGRLIDCARNLFHRALLMTTYTCGLRRSEVCKLKVSDIDSQRLLIPITQGKGGVDRDVPIGQLLLETLRGYWRWTRPKLWLFPGTAESVASRPTGYSKADLVSRRLCGQEGGHHQTGFRAHSQTQLGKASAGSRHASEDASGACGPRRY